MADKKDVQVRKFCGLDLNINDFYKTFPYNIEGKQNHEIYQSFNGKEDFDVEFLGFEWFYIGDKKLGDDCFDNKTIKAGGTDPADVESISFDFRKNGYDVSKFPGMIDQHGKVINGRTKNRAAKENKQAYVPVARVRVDCDESKETSAYIALGSIANSKTFHKTQHINTLNDYIEQGVAVVQSEEVTRDFDTIFEWYMENTNFQNDFDVDAGSLKRVVKIVLKRTAFEYSLVNSEIDNDKFVENYKLSNLKHQGKISLYKAKNGMKFFSDKLLRSQGTPPPTLLYTDGLSPEDCGRMVYSWVKEIKELHEHAFGYVSNVSCKSVGKVKTITDNDIEDLITPEFDISFIVGVIPNLDRGTQRQLLKQGMAISVEDYIKDSGFKTSKKKTKEKLDEALGTAS